MRLRFGVVGASYLWCKEFFFGPTPPALVGDTRLTTFDIPADTSHLAIRRKHSLWVALLSLPLAFVPSVILAGAAATLFATLDTGAIIFLDLTLWPTVAMLFISTMGMAWGFRVFTSFSWPWNWVFAVCTDCMMAMSKVFMHLKPEWSALWCIVMGFGVFLNIFFHWAAFYFSLIGKLAILRMTATFGDMQAAQTERADQDEWEKLNSEMIIEYKPARKVADKAFWAPAHNLINAVAKRFRRKNEKA